MLPHVVLVAGMASVLFLAWRADHPRIEHESKSLRSTTQPRPAPSVTKSRLKMRMRSLGNALEASAYSPEPARGEAVRLLQR